MVACSESGDFLAASSFTDSKSTSRNCTLVAFAATLRDTITRVTALCDEPVPFFRYTGCRRRSAATQGLKVDLVKRQLMFFGFQALALAWAIVVLLRTVDLGWGTFTGIGLGMLGALPISFLGIRIHSRQGRK